MSLDRDQLLALEHAGTIAFPSPYPSTAQIKVVHHAKPQGEPDILLKVVHQISPRVRVSRLVRLEHARAVQFHGTPHGGTAQAAKGKKAEEPAGGTSQGGWQHWAADELHSYVKSHAKSPSASGGEHGGDVLFHHAILHVPENAPVLMQVDVGMNAAESAEYYPPLPKGTEYHFFCESKVEK